VVISPFAAEHPAEICLILEAYLTCDDANGLVCIRQEMPGLQNPIAI